MKTLYLIFDHKLPNKKYKLNIIINRFEFIAIENQSTHIITNSKNYLIIFAFL